MTDVHALSGAYAVDALDDLERARFERHLSECPDCQEEVASLREAAAVLAETVAITPPESLRAKVLADIATVRPLAPIVGEHAQQPAGQAAAESGEHSGAETPRRRFRTLLAVAASVAVIGGVVGVIQPWDDESPRDGRTDIEQVLDAPDRKRVVQEFEDGSTATMVVSQELGQAVVVTEDMAPPPDGSVYELWYQRGDRMVPAGVMPVDPDATVLLDGDAGQASAVGITLEPADERDDEPTLPPLATFPIAT